jgi:hypothetical protein
MDFCIKFCWDGGIVLDFPGCCFHQERLHLVFLILIEHSSHTILLLIS